LDVLGRLLYDAEMRQAEALRLPLGDRVERAPPGLEVDVGRRADGRDEGRGRDDRSRDVPRVARSILREVGDMVRGVPGSRPRLEAEHLSPDDVDVLSRDGDELAPEPVEVVPV